MIYCQVEKCPYYSNNFCTRRVVGIDAMGRCDYLYINGMLRKNFDAINQNCKEEVNIYEIKEEITVTKEERKDNE